MWYIKKGIEEFSNRDAFLLVEIDEKEREIREIGPYYEFIDAENNLKWLNKASKHEVTGFVNFCTINSYLHDLEQKLIEENDEENNYDYDDYNYNDDDYDDE